MNRRKVLIVAADEEGIISRAAEKLRQSQIPAFTEGAFALVLGTEEDQGTTLELTENTSSAQRFLSCGIPTDFADQLEAGAKSVTLERLAKPVWNASL